MLPFIKLDISIWCRCFLSIFDFDSDSRPHFRSESVQRFIYCNKIGFFVHKRRVCKEQLELVLPFIRLDISIWCRCFLSIFDFDSDSRPHFRSESAQRFIYCKVHRRRLIEFFDPISVQRFMYWSNIGILLYIPEGYILSLWISVTILYDADVFFQFSILIRILDLISDPNQPRDSFIVIKLDSLSIREEFVRSNGN